jgi:exodeoxyribonuclease-3
MRLLTYNICKGGRGRESAIAAVIGASNPDLVILQEATRPAAVARIAGTLDMPFRAARPGHSLAFMSRVPIATYAWYRPFGSRHAFLEVVPEGQMVRVFGVHLSAVHAAWTERRRMWELRALLAGIRKHQAGFHVLAGDFNTLAPGAQLDIRALPLRLRALVMLSGGRVRWRTIDAVLDAGYTDAFRMSHPHQDGMTFPVWNPHVRLDYVFVPPAHASRITRCEVVRDAQAARASDHFPLLVDFDASHDPRIKVSGVR